MHENNDPAQIQLTDPIAIAHSDRLQDKIIARIQSKGALTFQQFMQMALYEPGLGYYTAGSQKFGSGGDFVTAPELSPLFSQALANQCEQVLKSTGGNVLEFGAGSGIMAANILKRLDRLNCLPERYWILDLSADLRQRQQQTIQQIAPELLDRVEWLDALPVHFDGVVLANEVLDAMPVDIFRIDDAGLQQQMIDYGDDRLTSRWQPASMALQASVDDIQRRYGRMSAGYLSEVNLNVQGWIKSISAMLGRGAVLLIDYGYSGFEYYHAERRMGTLICHYQHRAHDDPLILLGLQDITANVDFSAVAEAGRRAGLSVAGYAPQANFLVGSGIEQLIEENLDGDEQAFLKLSQGVKVLMLPTEMGERFKVLALTKDFQEPLRGFSMRDFRDRL